MIDIALLPALLALAASSAPPPIITFPGPQTSVPSPLSPTRVFYVEMGADEGGQNLSLRLDSGRGRPLRLRRFDRSVDIGWSSDGRRFLVNDYSASDSADCLIVRPQQNGVHEISLSRAIARSRGRPGETAANSHYYVHCDGWLSDRIVRGEVEGHRDEPAAGPIHPYAFEHRFSYDVMTGRISWLGHRIWDANDENRH